MKLILAFSFVAFGLVAQSASAGVGGFMSGCYDGGFKTGVVCQSASAQALTRDGTMKVFAKAEGQYLPSNGNNGHAPAQIDVDLFLNDFANRFDPESSVPVLVRAIVRGHHRDYSYQVKSIPLTLDRIYGERTLRGHFNVVVNNYFGAEYVEELMKIEVVVPGIGEVLVVNF